MKKAVDVFKDDTVKVVIDPRNVYNASPERIINACGWIPLWVTNPEDLDKPIKQVLEERYPFGLYQMKGEVMKDGVYRSPYHEPDPETGESDPDLYPLVYIERGTDKVYQYPHGMVAFKQEGDEWFVTRMD